MTWIKVITTKGDIILENGRTGKVEEVSIIRRIIEITFFILLFIMPFSYQDVSERYLILFSLAAAAMVWIWAKKKAWYSFAGYRIAFAILFLITFDFSEKVNFMRLFEIQAEAGYRIPLATIVLAMAFLSYLFEITFIEKQWSPNHSWIKYFYAPVIFLCLLMITFYPILKINYQISAETDIALLRKLLQYSMILLILQKYFYNETGTKKLSVGAILSLSTCIVVAIVMKIVNPDF